MDEKEKEMLRGFRKCGVPTLTKTTTNMGYKRGLDIEICTDEDTGRVWLWVCPLDDDSDKVFVVYDAQFDFDVEDEVATFAAWKLNTASKDENLEDLPLHIFLGKTETYARELIKYIARLI